MIRFRLEQFVRPGTLGLAVEAERRGIPVMEMCLSPTYNQRCWSCGLHHGWGCRCGRGEKAEAYEVHLKRKRGEGGLYPNAPLWMRLRANLVPTSGAEIVPAVGTIGDVPTGLSLQCEKCEKRPREGRYRLCSGCRKARQREG